MGNENHKKFINSQTEPPLSIEDGQSICRDILLHLRFLLFEVTCPRISSQSQNIIVHPPYLFGVSSVRATCMTVTQIILVKS